MISLDVPAFSWELAELPAALLPAVFMPNIIDLSVLRPFETLLEPPGVLSEAAGQIDQSPAIAPFRKEDMS